MIHRSLKRPLQMPKAVSRLLHPLVVFIKQLRNRKDQTIKNCWCFFIVLVITIGALNLLTYGRRTDEAGLYRF